LYELAVPPETLYLKYKWLQLLAAWSI